MVARMESWRVVQLEVRKVAESVEMMDKPMVGEWVEKLELKKVGMSAEWMVLMTVA